MTHESLTAMSVEQLRDYARKHTSLQKTAIVFMKKVDLVAAILDPTTVARRPVGGNGGATVTAGPAIDLAAAIAEALQGRITAGLDENRVMELIADAIEAGKDDTPAIDMIAIREMINQALSAHIKTIEIKGLEGIPDKNMGVQHFLFERVLNMVNANIPLILVGPAGSGKTYMVHTIADAMGIRFIPQSVTAQTSLSALMGYMSASGAYVSSPFRDAYEMGGLFLLDEIDAGNANVLSALNAATSNGVCLFPDNVLVEKHESFRIVGGANTYGRGANRQYAGRNPIDGATLDRFTIIDMPYDEALENALCTNREWAREVQAIRAAVDSMPDVKHIVSPRATFAGEKLLSLGEKKKDVMDMVIWKGLNEETKRRIMSAVRS
jgi:MoxR-like ATPase